MPEWVAELVVVTAAATGGKGIRPRGKAQPPLPDTALACPCPPGL